MTGIRCNDPRDFPRIAKEMGFCFSLRRGRVDWHKIGAIDVDRLVQERDLASLQENLISVINYNLDSEYDVKILDPNFVKLFKLAQLSIDYLLYSEQHLYNCIELVQEDLQKCTKEIEKLKRECKKKDNEIKNLKKKLKTTQEKKSEAHWHQHCSTNNGEVPSSFYQCSHCGKKFLTATFLEGHHRRRHTGIPFSKPPDPFLQETERLQSEIKELKERLNSTERLLNREPGQEGFEDRAESGRGRGDEGKSNMSNWLEEKRRMEAEQRKYLNEIAELKDMFYSEIKRLKEASAETSDSPSKPELLEQIRKQDEELANLRDRMSGQSTPDLENVQGRLEAQERFWKSRLKQTELQHMKEIEQLKIQLSQARETQTTKHNSAYEEQILKLMEHAARQDEALKTQAEQILQLTKIQSRKSPSPDKQIQKLSQIETVEKSASDNTLKSDPAATFAQLAARIENAIHATRIPSDVGDNIKEQPAKSSHQVPRQSKKEDSKSKQSNKVPVKSVPSPAYDVTSETSLSPKTTEGVSKTVQNLIPTSQPTTIVPKTFSEESSSDSSPHVENIEIASMYGPISKKSLKEEKKLPEKAWNEKEKSASLQGSKDSGLDSPKRFSTAHVTPVTKINAFPKVQSKTAVISVGEDKLDNVTDSDSQENDAEEDEDEVEEEEVQEEEMEEVEEEEVEEEEEETSEEESAEESGNETDAKNELADRSIHSLADAIQQNPQILKELKQDLRELLARRLRELGVDPEWEGIPSGTFKQKMATLKHHQNITAKRHKSFFKIKKRMLEELEKRVSEKTGDSHKGKIHGKGEKKPKGSSPQNKMAMKKFVGKVKTKALSVLKRSTNKDIKGITGTLATQPQEVPSVRIHTKESTSIKPDRPTVAGFVPTKKRSPDRKPAKTRGAVKIDSRTAGKPDVRVMTSTPVKTTTPAVSTKGSILKGSKTSSMPEHLNNKRDLLNPSISSVEDEEEEEEEDEEDIIPRSSNARQQTTHVFTQPQSKTTVSGPSVTAPKTHGSSLEHLTDQDSPKGSKSALKSASSMGSIVKKRVLFVDQDLDSDDQHSDNNKPIRPIKPLSKPWNVSKTITSSRLSRSNDGLVVDPNSDTRESSAKTVAISSTVTNNNSNRTSDSDSDWGLSSIQENLVDAAEHAGSSLSGSQERINLSTKQSAKIAQISKNIEAQLKLTRSKPPVGGVEAMFRADKQTTSSTSITSLLSENRENNINIANTATPSPKSRTIQPQPSTSKQTPSDWDLEDFDD